MAAFSFPYSCFFVLFRSHTGENMATEWFSRASAIGITRCKQIAGVGTDGQYLKNRVPQRFLQGLDGVLAERFDVPIVWDPCEWLSDFSSIILLFWLIYKK